MSVVRGLKMDMVCLILLADLSDRVLCCRQV